MEQLQKIRPKHTGGMNPELSKLGNNLVTKFHVLMRVSQIYDSKNMVLQQSVQESLHAINTFINQEGNLCLKIVADDIFLNEQRLRYSVEGFTSFKYLMTQWKKRLIGEVLFRERVDERALRTFINTVISLEEGNEENASLFNGQMSQHHIFSIEAHPLETIETEIGAINLKKEDFQKVAQRIFFESIRTLKEVTTNIDGKQQADIRKLKRLVRKAVHLVMEDDSILLGMTTVKNVDAYTYNHSVNVAIFSMAMGRRLSFSKKTLVELGITAMLHDIGKSKIPIEILNKPGQLSEEEWNLMKRHPLTGVEILLNLKQLGDVNLKMVTAIFEHHLRKDCSGYPRLFRKERISLFGRIIQIADAYDAMTTPKPHKMIPYTPEQALAVMLKEKEVHFDSILLKMFIGVVGIYPIGSLVLLDTHEVGIVFKSNPDPQWLNRPQVMLVQRDERGRGKKEIVDLTEEDGGGRFRWSIIKTLDPNQYHIDIAKYFLLT